MLNIRAEQYLDVNWIGIGLACVIMLIVLFYPLAWHFIILLEILLITTVFVLYKHISRNKNFIIICNAENKWFIQSHDKSYEVTLKDYWLLTKYLFIWLKGQDKSVSILLSRSIIGAELFSQLRTKIS